MDSKEITTILGRQLFEMGHSPICANFQTMSLHECDIISVNSGGNLCEFEIKISASDFKADFKKIFKHTTLEKGPYAKISKQGTVTHLACSYFTYVCPACLIREDQVPPYAGLIWIHADGRIDHKIKAPLLHKFKADAAIIKKIAHNLTQKQLFGGSHMNMVSKENKERVEGYKANQKQTQFNMMVSLASNKPIEHQKRMLEAKYREDFESGKQNFPELMWVLNPEPIPLEIPTPITIPITIDKQQVKAINLVTITIPYTKPIVLEIVEPEPEPGKRHLVKKGGRTKRR